MTTAGRTGPVSEPLTRRQEEVLELLRRSYTNEQIAQRLGISLDGAKWHVSEIIGRLGVSDRHEAARWRPQGERRPWWSLVWLRELRWGSAASAASLVVIIIVAIGVAALAWGVWRAATDDDGVAATSLGRSAELPSDTLVVSTMGGTIAVNTETGVVKEIISGLAAPPLAISPDGTRIAFVCDRDLVSIEPNGTGNNLCAFDAATSAVTMVAAASELPVGWTLMGETERMVNGEETDEAFPGYATWSPDGSKLAFLAYEPPYEGDFTAAVYLKDLRSGELRRVSDGPRAWEDPVSWSADGSRISIVEGAPDGAAEAVTWWLRRATTWLRIVDTATGTAWALPWSLDGYMHVWSPDGGEIAINTGFGIETVRTVDQSSEPFFTPVTVFRGDAGGYYSLVWSPDGEWILARTSDGMTVAARDGREWHRVGGDPDGGPPAAWSPDGKRIAFIADSDSAPYASLIHVADTSGADPREVVAMDPFSGSGDVYSIAWSGDGERLFYTTERGCGDDDDCGRLYMVPLDGSAPARQLFQHPVIDILPQ